MVAGQPREMTTPRFRRRDCGMLPPSVERDMTRHADMAPDGVSVIDSRILNPAKPDGRLLGRTN